MAKISRSIDIGAGYDNETAEAIAQEVVDFIVERTRKKGLDKNNEKFPGYSEVYKKSFDFKVAGKTSKVNLSLSDEMLDSIEVLKASNRRIEIGIEGSKELVGKAEGNIKGTYGDDGKSKKNRTPRDFLGIAAKDLQNIIKKYPLDEESRAETARRSKVVREINRLIVDKDEED